MCLYITKAALESVQCPAHHTYFSLTKVTTIDLSTAAKWEQLDKQKPLKFAVVTQLCTEPAKVGSSPPGNSLVCGSLRPPYKEAGNESRL